MKAIPIYNPSRTGSSHCSPKKAAYYIAHGRAVMRPEGTLQFTQSNQEAFHRRLDLATQAFDDAVRAGRPTVFWNGAYTDGAYPPGCNVQIKRIPWRKSRYCHELLT